jgi:PAT family beta-lactamase induction signal transducer AmpG
MMTTARLGFRLFLSPRMWLAGLMGFASGLPLLLTLSVLQAWLKAEGVDLATIGFIGLVGLPYTLKFLWAPLFDRYIPSSLGRRRGWLVIFQVLLAGGIAVLGLTSPADGIPTVAAAALLVAFFSASQDIVIDAYRRESLADAEQGLGAAYYVCGYQLGTLLAAGGGLILADVVGFKGVYLIMAGVMAAAIIVTLLAPEPKMAAGQPTSLRDAFAGPLVEFFQRRDAVLVLAFILLYKLGDNMASHMSIPFYLDIGFSNTEIGSVVKLLGTWAIFIGTFAGGALILRLGLFRALLLFGVLQGLSTAGFALLAMVGHNLFWLGGVVAFENLTIGLGRSALLAFMASLTNRRFTATQFALLASLAGVPRVIVSAPTGWLAEQIGWVSFFVSCAVIAIPGLVLLSAFRTWLGEKDQATAARAEP